MLRSLFSGISGLRAHQQMMDVTGNNIANVNTVGFKSSQTVFEDTLSQMLKGASSPQNNIGGTNPAQVGLGVQLAGIATNFGQGAAEVTGRSTDLMINGDGFFVVKNGNEQLYTRAGSFSFDTNGTLVDPNGHPIQGWAATAGVVNTKATPSDVTLPIATLLAPTPTSTTTIGGNLPGDDTNFTTPTTLVKTIKAYDQQGIPVTLSATFTHTSATTWDVAIALPLPSGASATQTMTFLPDGTLDTATTPTPFVVGAAGTTSAITVDFSTLTNFAGPDTSGVQAQNGFAMGSLQGFSIGGDGILVGVFSNGLKQNLAQIALASFNNPPGLEKTGDSLYRSTSNSGVPQLGMAGAGGRGQLQGNTLEMSNVDLAQEFTNMVIAQRGFEANAKVITTSDELLNDLINLKR